MRYPLQRERFFMQGFQGISEAEERRRETICASRIQDFAWLRVNPCIEKPNTSQLSPIRGSRDAADYFQRAFDYAGRQREYFMVLCLDVKNVPMAAALIHIGGRSDAVLDASAVFHPAVLVQAVNIIVAHNHPSGDIVPSFDDIEITKRLVAAGKNLGVGILDHLVLTDDDNRYGSFLDRGLMS